MILLDMQTIIFSNVITDIVCLMVIVLLWQQNRKRFSGTELFVFDFALQTAALFMIVARGRIFDWVSIVLSNTMVIAGALLGYIGLTHFVGKKSSQAHNYVLLAAFALIHTYFTFVQPDLAARNLNLALALLIICWQCAWLMLYRTEPDKRGLTRGVGFVFAVYCMVSVIRIVDFFTGPQTTSDYFQSGIFAQLIMISYQMLFILLTYALVLMFNKSLLTNVKIEEEKFNKAFHSSPYAITITRMSDGQIIEVNESFFRITGYQSKDIRGKTTPALHLWNREEDRALVVSELASKGTVQEREFQFRKKSGEIITGIFSAGMVTINNEMCVLSSINDITDRKRAEEGQRQKDKEMQTMLKSMINAFVLFGSVFDEKDVFVSYRFIYINEAYERITGVKIDDVRGKTVHEVWPETEPEWILKYGEVAISGISQTFDQYHHSTKKHYHCHAYRPWDSMQEFCVIFEDITELKQMEFQREAALKEIESLNSELEQKIAERTTELHNSQLALLNLVDDLNQSAKDTDLASRKLEETNNDLKAFSYSVSHDLRAPLRSIDGFSLALMEDYQEKLDDTGRNYLNRIRAATQHMGLLIEDMLKLSRISHTEFYHESIDLSKIVQSIAKTLQQNNPDNDTNVIIQQGMVTRGDINTMRIALTNLLENAWKFTGKQKHPLIEFGMTLTEGKKIFFVRDNGVGFDMAYANKLFGAFQRLHSTDEFPGTGIGLATVKRIITRHGGQIWADGEVGRGATFYFTIPE
ncbi:MAG: PAS domain S-box protein [Deltaproteobacteria bacterium]|nr:PAS domain S-box protein [Deltaproteobacteria bacterium]